MTDIVAATEPVSLSVIAGALALGLPRRRRKQAYLATRSAPHRKYRETQNGTEYRFKSPDFKTVLGTVFPSALID